GRGEGSGRGGGGKTRLDDAALLGEGGERGAHGAVGRGDEGAAVEDQLVVAADGVAVNDRRAQLAGGVGDELFAQIAFAVVPGAGGKVDHQIHLFRGEQSDRIDAVESART